MTSCGNVQCFNSQSGQTTFPHLLVHWQHSLVLRWVTVTESKGLWHYWGRGAQSSSPIRDYPDFLSRVRFWRVILLELCSELQPFRTLWNKAADHTTLPTKGTFQRDQSTLSLTTAANVLEINHVPTRNQVDQFDQANIKTLSAVRFPADVIRAINCTYIAIKVSWINCLN